MHTQSSHAPTKKECVQKKAGEKVLRVQHEANLQTFLLPARRYEFECRADLHGLPGWF